jgi:hypothetical protein
MKSYLEGIAQRIGAEDAAVILWEVDAAFREARQQSSDAFTPRFRELHDLVRFCKFDAIAPWLNREREALGRALAFARKVGEHKVADILEAALDGKPQPPVSLSVTLPGQEPRKLEVDAGEVTKFAGEDWGGADIALSFAMDGFMEAVLRELVAASSEFELQPPVAVRQRAQADSKIGADVASGRTAADLFRRLVTGSNPRMQAGAWEDYERRAVEQVTIVPIQHLAYAPASPDVLRRLRKDCGAVAQEILDVYALHDSA